MLSARVTTNPIVGTRRVNPSDCLRKSAHAISSSPAKKSVSQATAALTDLSPMRCYLSIHKLPDVVTGGFQPEAADLFRETAELLFDLLLRHRGQSGLLPPPDVERSGLLDKG